MITSVSAANESGVVKIVVQRETQGQVFSVSITDRRTGGELNKVFSPGLLALFMETMQSLTPRG